jgi:hypothetical protein
MKQEMIHESFKLVFYWLASDLSYNYLNGSIPSEWAPLQLKSM